MIYGLGNIDVIPFFIYPFMTTKSPLVFAIFVTVSLWIKNREKVFLRFGATKEEYQKYTLTNRNSLSFSIHLSIIIAFYAIIEILLLIVLVLVFFSIKGDNAEGIETYFDAFGIGQAFSCLIAIPFILLYSYTREHKNGSFDLIIPMGGFALIAFVYIEYIYQFLMHTFGE